MKDIIQQEKKVTIFGVEAMARNVVASVDDAGSVARLLNQGIKAARKFTEDGRNYRITVSLRFDDNCSNGHPTFAITGEIRDLALPDDNDIVACGCIHDDIAKHFPELAHIIKWHLCSTDGPTHYLANTLYLAGERDHNGLLAGEKKQLRNGKTGELAWQLVAVAPDGSEHELHSLPKYLDGAQPPENTWAVRYVPWCCVGKGKSRDLDAARNVAIWPEATDAELCVDPDTLRAALVARLPALVADFKKAMLECGFIWHDGNPRE